MLDIINQNQYKSIYSKKRYKLLKIQKYGVFFTFKAKKG